MWNMRDLIPWSRDREVATGERSAEHPLMPFQREFDRLFDEMWSGFGLPVARLERVQGTAAPKIDVRETESEIEVTAELPGLEEKDVEVTLADNVLTLRGEKKANREETHEGYTYTERSFGTFTRRIPLPAEVTEEKVGADFHNGVLTVHLPKSPKAQEKVRKIPIGGTGAGAPAKAA